MVTLQSSFLNYRLIARDLSQALARKAAEPIVAREVARFTEAARGIHSVDALFDDDRTYTFAVRAYGMDELAYARALVRRVVSEGTGVDSYAGRMSDSRYLDLAGAFRVTGAGGTPSVLAASAEAVVQRYRDDLDAIGRRGSGDIEAQVLAYRQEVGTITTFEELVDSDLALTFSLRAFGLDHLTGRLDAVRQVVNGGKNDLPLADAQQQWLFDRFRLSFGIRSGAVGWQEEVIAGFRVEAPKFGERLAASLDADIAAFHDGLAAIDSVDDLVSNWDVLGIGLRAFGLEHLAADRPALAAALKGDARALKLADAREAAGFDAFRAAFAFDGDGRPSPAALLRDVEATVAAYIRQSLETDVGAQDNNVRLALNFQRRAATIKSAYDILADEALAAVVRTAFGIAPETAAADIDAQARMIASRIDIADFQDPEKVGKLIDRFLLLADREAGASGAPILSLFDGAGADLSYDLLHTRQALRR